VPRLPMTEEEFAAGRTRILREAAIIMGRDGVAGLSMRTLAKSLGLTPGALYRYFPSKQEMLLAYWESSLRTLSARIVAIGQTNIDATSAIRRILAEYALFCLEDKDRFRLLFLHYDDGMVSDVESWTDGLAPYDLLLKHVRIALQNGAFRRCEAAQICNTLWAGIHGAVVLLLTVKEIDFGDPQTFIAHTADTLMRGLSQP